MSSHKFQAQIVAISYFGENLTCSVKANIYQVYTNQAACTITFISSAPFLDLRLYFQPQFRILWLTLWLYVCVYEREMKSFFFHSFCFRFCSHRSHCAVLSRVPCAIQQVPIRYLFYNSVYMSIPISPFIPSLCPLGNCNFVFYICDSVL